MNFSLEKSIDVLGRTPDVLAIMLSNISNAWTSPNEGEDTWSVFDIVGHLIHGEKTDWIPRMNIILSDSGAKMFVPFDRHAQFVESDGQTLDDLLTEFKKLRQVNIEYLLSKNLTHHDLAQKGMHPSFGEVTLAQLLSTWVVHDLNHIAQIMRVMAKQYKEEVGPWVAYLGILQR